MKTKKEKFYKLFKQISEHKDMSSDQFEQYVQSIQEEDQEIAWRILILLFNIAPVLKIFEAGIRTGGETFIVQAADDIEILLAFLAIVDEDEWPESPVEFVKILQEKMGELRKEITQMRTSGMSSENMIFNLLREFDMLREAEPASESIN